jgi:hypothetical protein
MHLDPGRTVFVRFAIDETHKHSATFVNDVGEINERLLGVGDTAATTGEALTAVLLDSLKKLKCAKFIWNCGAHF